MIHTIKPENEEQLVIKINPEQPHLITYTVGDKSMNWDRRFSLKLFKKMVEELQEPKPKVESHPDIIISGNEIIEIMSVSTSLKDSYYFKYKDISFSSKDPVFYEDFRKGDLCIVVLDFNYSYRWRLSTWSTYTSTVQNEKNYKGSFKRFFRNVFSKISK